jgi:hypothetical protein
MVPAILESVSKRLHRSASRWLAIPLGSSRASLFILMLLFTWPYGISVADAWPVEQGKRETVTLTALRSVPQAIYDSLFGDQYDFVTLVEYETSKSLGVNTREVSTTGNSVTFRVDTSQELRNVVSGSGPKVFLPSVAYYNDGQILDKEIGGGSSHKNGKITIIVHSASLQDIQDRKNHRYDQTPSPETVAEAVRNPPGIQTKSGLANTGDTYCGYTVLRDAAAFETLNPHALAGLTKPFDAANVFVRFDANRDISKVVYCTPGPGSTVCRSEEFLNSWAPLTLYFDSQFLCVADDLAGKARAHLKSHIIRESTSTGFPVDN